MKRADFVAETLAIWERSLRDPVLQEARQELESAIAVLERTYTAEELEVVESDIGASWSCPDCCRSVCCPVGQVPTPDKFDNCPNHRWALSGPCDACVNDRHREARAI